METNTNTMGTQTPMGDPGVGSPQQGGSPQPPGTTPSRQGTTIQDPNKVRDPDTEAPSKVEDPAPVEMPDIAKPDSKPNVGKGGNAQTPKEPVE